MPDAPSDVVDWAGTASVAVESTGSTTIAMVTTMWSPDVEALFPEIDWDDPQGSYAVEQREEGLVLVNYEGASPTTTAPAPPADEADEPADPVAPDGSDDGEDAEDEALAAERQAEAEALQSGRVSGDGSPGGSVATDVRTIPWSELGVGGLADIDVDNRLLRHTGDGWEPVEATGLDGFSSFNLGVAGDQFVATGWGRDGRTSTALVSADGAAWAPLEGVTGHVIGVGPALVEIPWESTTIRVSGDAGASWSDVDLSAVAGIAEDSLLMSSDGGPMGLALIATGPEGEVRDLVVSGDLMDWTTTPMADVIQSDDEPVAVQALVGEDRIVVSATMGRVSEDEPPPTRTAIGTPVRG